MKVIPTEAVLGAEIAGVDLSRRLDDAMFAAIERAYNEALSHRPEILSTSIPPQVVELSGLLDGYSGSHGAGLDPARPVNRGGRFSRKAATPSARSGVRAAIAWLRASMLRTSSSDMPSPW